MEIPFWLVSPSMAQYAVWISAHTDGGPRSRVCARETLRSAPHRRERKFSGTRVCKVVFKHLPLSLKDVSDPYHNPL